MKLTRVRLNKDVPEMLAKPLPKKSASMHEVLMCVREIFVWAGEDPDDTERGPEAAEKAWNGVAIHLAFKLLPCFSNLHRKSGGRPKGDKEAAAGSPLSINDAEWLVRAIDAIKAKRKAAGEPATLLASINEAKSTYKANKVFKIRSAKTLERLYFQARQQQRQRSTRRLVELLIQPQPRFTGLFGLGEIVLEQEKATGTKSPKIK